MDSTIFEERPLVQSVLHPTDFSDISEAAFAHALAIALIRQTQLTLLHVTEGGESGRAVWTAFPAVRGTLEQWGLLEPGAPSDAVFDELGVMVKKVALRAGDPVKAILGWMDDEPVDLIVLATRGKDGMPRWFQPSVAEELARKSKTMTLFVPRGARGLVDAASGRLSLRRILLPVVREPNPAGAVLFATRIALLAGDGDVEINLLHVGAERPDLELPQDPAWKWSEQTRSGDVVGAILAAANEAPTDLIAMATAGHQGIFDALRGSTTEQVVRHAPCPVLAVPSA